METERHQIKGTHATKSTFDPKQSHFGGQVSGSRIENYKTTPETECSAKKLVSISPMPVYQDKTYEELRWEDYKSTEKGGFGKSPGSNFNQPTKLHKKGPSQDSAAV